MSDILDRPSWYINRIGKKDYGRAFERICGRLKQKERKGEEVEIWIRIIRISWFYRCYRGSEDCVFLLRVLRAVMVICQWMNTKWNASKVSFYEIKTKTRCTIRKDEYYVINYYYCYDYYLQWLLHHYRIIMQLNA